jgi:hypothetical protein
MFVPKKFNVNAPAYIPVKRRARKRGKNPQKSATLHAVMPLLNIPFPMRLTCTLSTSIPQYTVGGAASVDDNFISNTVYEPNNGIGVNCSNYTILYDIYEQSIVKGSAIELQVSNTSATIPLQLVLYPCGIASAPGSYAIARAQRSAKCITIAPAGSGPSVKTLRHSVDFASFFGLANLSAATSEYAATVSSHPSLLLYWQFCFYSADGSSNLSADVAATITSRVDWFGFPLNGL